MIAPDGSEAIGIWRYSDQYIVYQTGDLLIGKLNGNYNIALVKSLPPGDRFKTTPGLDFQTVVQTYCENPLANTVTRNYILKEIAKSIAAFNVAGDRVSLLEAENTLDVDKTGLYRVNKRTKASGLPLPYQIDPNLLGSLLGYCRISVDHGIYYRELWDFKNKRAFISSGNLGSGAWDELTGSGVDSANIVLDKIYNTIVTENKKLQIASNNLSSRLQYRKFYPVITGSNILLFTTDIPDSYIINLRKQETSLRSTFTRKYSIQVSGEDPDGTIYDPYGTRLSNLYDEYKTFQFAVNQGDVINYSGYQGPNGLSYLACTKSDGTILATLEGSPYNTAKTGTYTVPNKGAYVYVTNYNADPTAYITTPGDLTQVGGFLGSLTPSGRTDATLILGSGITLTSIYEIVL